MPVFQHPGRCDELSDQVRETMKVYQKTFRQELNTTLFILTVFVRGSIDAVIKTLLEAIALVVIVVVVFLQTGVHRLFH